VRMRQQRLLGRLHSFRDERAAVPVRSSDEARSHVVARSESFAMWVPSLTDKIPPVSLLFSEYPASCGPRRG